MSDATKIRVTQLRGLSHKSEAQRLCIKGLGLRRIGHTVELRVSCAEVRACLTAGEGTLSAPAVFKITCRWIANDDVPTIRVVAGNVHRRHLA